MSDDSVSDEATVHHSVTSLAQTLDYIEVVHQHLLEDCSLDQLLLKLAERKIPLYISRELYKKLSYRREAARCLVLLSILVSR